jgi:SP family sugar:H+ symporter-like MFS transporter
MPESPRWALKNNRPEQARRSIERIAGVPKGENNAIVDHDFAEMQDSIEREGEVANASWIECFKPKDRTLYRTLLGMTLQSLQQLTGANYCQFQFFFFLFTQTLKHRLSASFLLRCHHLQECWSRRLVCDSK